MVVRRGLDVPGLRTGGSLGRVLPDGPAYLVPPIVQRGLAGTLHKMTALHTYIVALLLIHLSVQKSVGFVSGDPGDPLDGAGLFRRLLLCQPFTGLVQPFLPALHAELGLVELGLFAVGMELLATVTRSSPALGRLILSVFHWRRPPAWWSAGRRSRHGGSGQQTGW